MRGLFFFVALCATTLCSASRVLLRDVEVITLQKDKLTTGRRSAPLPQIVCTNCPPSLVIASIQCRNTGFDGKDVNWECKAMMDDRWKLAKAEVGCEGYEHSQDPFILQGSCNIEVEVAPRSGATQSVPPSPSGASKDLSFHDAFVFGFLLFIFCIILFFFCDCARTQRISNVRVENSYVEQTNDEEEVIVERRYPRRSARRVVEIGREPPHPVIIREAPTVVYSTPAPPPPPVVIHETRSSSWWDTPAPAVVVTASAPPPPPTPVVVVAPSAPPPPSKEAESTAFATTKRR